MSNKIVTSKKGFSLLAFFLGILFGIIILAGALFGLGYFALSADLDKVLGIAGMDNSKDENGVNKYVNTDPESGGAKNLLELLQKLYAMTADTDNLTIGQIDSLIPAASGMTDGIMQSLSGYVEVDEAELKNVKFGEFDSYFSELVMDIRPAKLISGEMNNFSKLLLTGIEADSVEADGEIYPLYFDEEKDVYAYPSGEEWLIAEKSEDGFVATGEPFSEYNAETCLPTGNYYTKGEETVYIDPITLRSLTGTGGMGALGRASVTELLGNSGEDGIVNKLLDDVTVEQFMNGEADLNGKVNDLEISDLIDVDETDGIMAYLAFGVCGLDTEEGTAYLGGQKVFIGTDDGKITGVYSDADLTVAIETGTKISGINARMSGLKDELTIGELIKSDSGNTILNALKNSTINSLASDIDDLTINELYADQIYGVADTAEDGSEGEKVATLKKVKKSAEDADGEIDFNPMYLYYEASEGKYGQTVYRLVDSGAGKGKLESPEEDKDYYTYGRPSKFWELLVTERDEVREEGDEHAYSINHLTSMIDNISKNMNHFTLNSLSEAGILNFKDPDKLETTVIPEGIGEYGGRKLGELTVPDAISAMMSIIDRMHSL